MARRGKDLLEFIPALAGVIFMGFYFVPGFGSLLLYLGIFLLIVFAGVVVYRIATTRNNEGLNSQFDTAQHFAVAPTEAAEKSPSDKLRDLDWFQFEKLIAAMYTAKGYTVNRLGGAHPDGGVDLIIERGEEKNLVQCKHWKKWKVGVRNVREFLGTLTDTRTPRGIFITLSGYTADAQELASKHGNQLIDEYELLEMLDSVNWKFNPAITSVLNDHRKFCPKCESQMVLRTASKGPNAGNHFWGCSKYPRCKFILDFAGS